MTDEKDVEDDHEAEVKHLDELRREAAEEEPAGSYEDGILGREPDPFVFGIPTDSMDPISCHEGRVYTAYLEASGFTSPKHLAALYAVGDHAKDCSACGPDAEGNPGHQCEESRELGAAATQAYERGLRTKEENLRQMEAAAWNHTDSREISPPSDSKKEQ